MSVSLTDGKVGPVGPIGQARSAPAVWSEWSDAGIGRSDQKSALKSSWSERSSRSDTQIVPAGPDDFAALAADIRPLDRLEAETVAQMPLGQALDMVAARSLRTTAGYLDGRLVAVWGVGAATVLSRTGTPWLLATNAMEDRAARRAFAALSRAEFAKTVEGFRRLWNYVHADNRLAVRWLRWLGFDFPGHRVTIGREPFLYFEKEMG